MNFTGESFFVHQQNSDYSFRKKIVFGESSTMKLHQHYDQPRND